MSGQHLRSMTFGILGEVGCRPLADAGSGSNWQDGPLAGLPDRQCLVSPVRTGLLRTGDPERSDRAWYSATGHPVRGVRPGPLAGRLRISPRSLTEHDLRVGKHKLDIRFWREREQTSCEVTRADPKLIERYAPVSKITQLRTASDPI